MELCLTLCTTTSASLALPFPFTVLLTAISGTSFGSECSKSLRLSSLSSSETSEAESTKIAAGLLMTQEVSNNRKGDDRPA